MCKGKDCFYTEDISSKQLINWRKVMCKKKKKKTQQLAATAGQSP